MSTPSQEMKEYTFRRFVDGDNRVKDWTRQIFTADASDKCPVYVHRTPPCQGSCPSGEDIRGWLQIVRGIEKPTGDQSVAEYAFRRSTTANPFPAMMGRVCPAPCQEGCNRNEVDDFVGINAVEQWIGDQAFENNFTFDAPAEMSGKKIAIIGGGPAGMSAAYQLRLKGHASTIFDEHEELGGMMRYGIPGYRTPRDHLDRECNRIVEMGGIELKLGVRVGRDVSVDALESEYDSILWAIGCQTGRKLPIKGADAPNCVSGVAYLEAFNKGMLTVVPEKLVCVGGGDTSIDVVSVARRLGASSNAPAVEGIIDGSIDPSTAQGIEKHNGTVILTSLFPRDEMTATEEEVEDALHEGVEIQTGVMPLEVILADDGRATGLKMAKCTMEDGRPVMVEGSEYIIEADVIVSAIGQSGDMSGLEEYDNGRGLMDHDAVYRVPGKDNHFVCGDIVRPHLLTTAIGQGSIAAETIDGTFKGLKLKKRPKVDVHHFSLTEKLHETGLDPAEYNHELVRGTNEDSFAIHNFEDRSKQEIIKTDEMFIGHFEHVERLLREGHGPTTEEVLGHFEERTTGFSDESAAKEADRCMSCGMCFECDNCVIYCPQDAVYRVKKDKSTTGRYVATDYTRCIGCHICSDVCPTGYIDMGLGDH